MDDFDIEMGDAIDVPLEEDPEFVDILVGDDQQEDGEVEEDPVNGEPADHGSQSVVPNKVHIRGLDLLNEDQLKAYVSAHVGGKGADRIEWVDDASANLVFSSDAFAHEALKLLSAVEVVDATQLSPLEVLPAKVIAERPEVALEVRFTVESDKKVKGAAHRSRFYLFHPEWDPETEEGKRRREGRDRRYRERDRDNCTNRTEHRRSGRGRRDDRNEEEPEPFDVNLYDDDSGALARRVTPRGGRYRRGRDSPSPSDRSDPGRYRTANSAKELFPNRRPRDPLQSERDSHDRHRSRSPARDEDDAIMDDLAKDREVTRNRERARSLKERITRPKPDNSVKELFPSKGAARSKAHMDQVPKEVLAGRITEPNKGISIKGLARQTNQQQGISIKGNMMKELFPEKLGGNSNAGKELFADKVENRGRRRQRAEDLYF